MRAEAILKSVLVWLIVAVSVLVPGCGRRKGKDDKIVIGLVLPSLSHPFFVYLQNSVLEEASRIGVDVVTADAENSAARQMAIVEDFIVRGVDGVLMSPIGADALVPAVEALNRAAIPVATVDRKVSGGEVLVHVGADNVEGGRAAARYIIERLGAKGAVIELEGTPGASAALDRKKGFDEQIGRSSVKIIASQTAEFHRAKGQAVMENLLQAHKNFQAVYAANDEMALGAIEAMEAHGVDLSKVVVVGFDAIPDALAYIRLGKLDATVEQFPGLQARKALQLLVEYLRTGQRPEEREIYIKPVVIDRNNLDQAERKSR